MAPSVHPTPNLYVFGHLFSLADQTSDGWRITPESVRRAHAAGLDATKIIVWLKTLALGDVPPELQVRIKTWCKYYGDAIVQTLTLVQFRDQSVVNELCADPLFARYMQPFKPTANLGLALVRPEDVAVLRDLLAQREIELREF